MKLLIKLFIFSIITFFFTSCKEKKDDQIKKVTIENVSPISPMERVLEANNPLLKRVLDSAADYEVQIMFTEIKRNHNNVTFKDYKFHVNDSNYFYPASSVKLPIAVLALEKLNKDKRFTINTPFYIEGDSVETTFKDEINKIFAVSDNEAYNRLFEYLGKDYINKTLKEKGLTNVQINHRLATDNAYEIENKPLIFITKDTLTEIVGSINTPIDTLKIENLKKGKGYMENDSIINEPMDFCLKNYLPVSTLHNIMKRIIFPENFSPEEQFNLAASDREFLLKSISTLPKNQGYDSEEYYDSYVKFFMYGDKKEDIPDSLKIYNKVGFAYGYLTDCSYIHDTKNNIEFIITATIHVNKNQIYNDGIYEYDKVGIPFLAELGRQFYKTQTLTN